MNGGAERIPSRYVDERATTQASQETIQTHGSVEVTFGNAYIYVSRPKDALEHLQEALRVFKELSRESPDEFLPDVAATLNNLGVLYSDTGRPDRAAQALKEAL